MKPKWLEISIISVGVVIFCASCSKTKSSVAGIPLKVADHGGSITPIVEEAACQAVDYFKITRIGDSYYSCNVSEYFGPARPEQSRIGNDVTEHRSPVIIVSTYSLSEADKINGIEWKGNVRIEAAATRSYSPKIANAYTFERRTEPDTTWSQWRSSLGSALSGDGLLIPHIEMDKVNGVWRTKPVPEAGYWRTTWRQVTTSDLPNM